MIEWKNIDGFPGYKVNSSGQIASFKRQIGPPQYWDISDSIQRILKYGISTHGYLIVNLRHDNTTFRKHVAHLVAQAFLGPCPDGMEVCHNDGDRQNNSIENLRYDTHQHNIHDAIRHGTMASLTRKQVLVIRRLRHNGASLKAIGRLFKIGEDIAGSISRGDSYSIYGGPRTSIPGFVATRKLSLSDVNDIRNRYQAGGITLAALGDEYGITESAVSLIVNHKRW